jgi:hypothetical protein
MLGRTSGAVREERRGRGLAAHVSGAAFSGVRRQQRDVRGGLDDRERHVGGPVQRSAEPEVAHLLASFARRSLGEHGRERVGVLLRQPNRPRAQRLRLCGDTARVGPGVQRRARRHRRQGGGRRGHERRRGAGTRNARVPRQLVQQLVDGHRQHRPTLCRSVG